jgi:putative nucleotidyltransferase with HDIG domain
METLKERALALLEQKLVNPNMKKHSLAVGAIMLGLAKYFSENNIDWEVAGILHDIDYEETNKELERHSIVGSEFTKANGFSDEIVRAILTHNTMHGILAETRFEKALVAADPMSGLITAAALVLPSKKLADVKTESVVRRFHEKSFAKGANRECIKVCEEIGLTLEEFSKISLESMQSISGQLGL